MSNNLKQNFLNPFKMKMYFILNLPLAFITGLKITEFEPAFSKVTIKFSYLTKNPFRSIYFACLAMAAELSSGSLAVYHTTNSNKKISMLVVGMQSNFIKKAVGKITFICNDGTLIENAIAKSIANNASESVVCKSLGFDESGETVAEFLITWSFKEKQIK